MSNSDKKLSSFEFLYSLHKRTVLTDWEASTEKLVQIALTFSWFFSAAPKLLLHFSQQLHNARENSNCLYTCRIVTLAIPGFLKSFGLYLHIMFDILNSCCLFKLRHISRLWICLHSKKVLGFVLGKSKQSVYRIVIACFESSSTYLWFWCF